jgi:beta-glucosidase
MAAYNRVNGHWCSQQHHVLTQIVKQEWGFAGAIMSDWFGTHATAPTLAAGLDLEMPGPARFLGPKAAEAVAAGELPSARVQDAAARVARLARAATGAKAPPAPAAEVEALLAEAAAAGMVLLKNEGALLPLDPARIRRLAVIGPNAAAPCFQGGTFAKISVRPDLPTPIEAIRARFGGQCEVTYAPGVDPAPRLPFMEVTPARTIGDGCTRGMSLAYFATADCSGEPLTCETRDTNSLVWFAGMHDQADFAAGGGIRASGIFTARQAGLHRFHLGATGATRMSVDGREIVSTTECPPGDTMGVLKAGDSEFAGVELAAGQRVLVEVTFAFPPARVHGLWYGIREPGSPAELLAEAERAAGAADAVVLVVGETSDSSVESKDRADTLLPAGQIELIERITAANPRTAIITNVGHAYDCSWEDRAAAHLACWYPGEGFAAALTAVLAGDCEPSGRLPVSIARREEDYPALALAPDADGRLAYAEGTRPGYRGIIAAGKSARHPLGSGLGYASFDWSGAVFEGGAVAINVRNTGARAGRESVQVYRDAPETALVGFATIRLEPGESARVQIPLPRRRFMTWKGQWDLPRAPIPIRIARHAEDAGFAIVLDPAKLKDTGL